MAHSVHGHMCCQSLKYLIQRHLLLHLLLVSYLYWVYIKMLASTVHQMITMSPPSSFDPLQAIRSDQIEQNIRQTVIQEQILQKVHKYDLITSSLWLNLLYLHSFLLFSLILVFTSSLANHCAACSVSCHMELFNRPVKDHNLKFMICERDR